MNTKRYKTGTERLLRLGFVLAFLLSLLSSCSLRHDQSTGEGVGAGQLEKLAQSGLYETSDEELTEAAEASSASLDEVIRTSVDSFDEAGAVRQALARGLDVGLAELALNGSEFEQGLARSALMPRIVGVLDIGDNEESLPANASRAEDGDIGAGIYLRQDLLTWGANRKRLKAAGFLTEGQESLVEMQKVDTAAAIHVGFATLRRIDGAKKAYRESISSFREFLSKAKDRTEAGIDSGRSVQEVQSRVADLEARVAMLEVEAEGTKAILDRLIGSDGGAKFKLYPAVIHSVPAGEVSSFNLDGRPDVAALASQLHAAELELGATKADRWPKVMVSGGVRAESDFEFDHQRSEATASAGARWVPMAGGAHKARQQLAQNQIEIANLKLSNARRVARAEVRAGLAAVKRARIARDASSRALSLTRKSLELTKVQQEAQRSEIDHVLNIQTRVMRAALQKVDADFAVQRQQILVKRSMGSMAGAGATLTSK